MASDHASANHAPHANLDVDYVISYRFSDSSRSEAEAKFEHLIRTLSNVGLDTEVRNGKNQSLLVFVKPATDQHLASAVYRSRVQDWLRGIRHAAPEQETRTSLESEPLTEAERLRVIYEILTNGPNEGGAGITPKRGEWKEVESVFPLHDHTFNKRWMKKWASTYVLGLDDQDEIRNKFGEKIAFYFTFLQAYLVFLAIPAALGFSAWVLLGSCSTLYGIVSCIWSVVFVEYWRKQEVDLRIRWGVNGVSAVQSKRPEFQIIEEAAHPVTKEKVGVFPKRTRLMRQLLQIPFALVAGLALGGLIATCFGIEIFISEVYNGPLKTVLVFLPTGLLVTLVPTISAVLTQFATRLNDYENYETQDAYEVAMTQKIFVLNFITSYLAIFLTAFVYIPFGSIIVPHLDIFGLAVQPFAEDEKQAQAPKQGFEINRDRLRKQVIYFTVTAQIVNLAMEVVVPFVKRKAFRQVQQMKSGGAEKNDGDSDAAGKDLPEEATFLTRARNEAELDHYDVTSDLREMCIQFGYLSMFSIVWPLTAVSFIINNWVEMRSDAIKICVEMQRPIPWRADSIGPWLDNLGFLAWLGSITTAALAYMFGSEDGAPDGTPSAIKGGILLLTIFFSEHLYFLTRLGVRMALSSLDSTHVQQERRERYLVRQRYLEGTSGLPAPPEPAPNGNDEKITRRSLEQDAREESLHAPPPEQRFWGRQRYWHEAAQYGMGIIRQSKSATEKKAQ
ncbi:MAG: hypothetical protein M1815_005821 [Lichina confinis]|nr:MAG: hypothetical protein M1815_005821 [Lichina confinis]